MQTKVILHEAEERGSCAEAPAIPECATQGERFEELPRNLSEPVRGCLSVDVEQPRGTDRDRVMEIAI